MKLCKVKASDIEKKWLVIDAANQPVGRLASQVAYLLRGKHKSNHVRHLDCGDFVVVVNAAKVVFTGKKWSDKIYYRHTNYIGGIKAVTAQDQKETHPDRIITTAVKGMLPKSKLGYQMLSNLKVYANGDHPHVAQKPQNAVERTAGKGEK